MSSSGNNHHHSPNNNHRTHPVAVHMTSANGTVHKIDKSLDNGGANDVSRPNYRRSRSRNRSRSRSNSATRSSRPTRANQNDATPLLDAELIPPTHAKNPELAEDDDDIDISFNPNESRPGVDDGFFPPSPNNNRPAIKPRIDDPEVHDRRVDIPVYEPEKPVGDIPMSRRPSAVFPYAPGFPGTGVQVMTDGEGGTRIIPDVNVYQQKKNLAQGMMDLALISANANQLRYVLEAFDRHPYYYFSVIFISFSLILQVGVGIGLILNSRYNVTKQDDICKADKINNFTIIGIFLITIVNVFIASFGVAEVRTVAVPMMSNFVANVTRV